VYSDGQRFEVKDPEPDENGNPGQSYKTSIRDIIPLPTDEELRNMPQFTAGSQVLARYPETTTFYRAEVTGTRRDKYRLKFEGEDDADKETEVSRGLVLNIPK
jgi:SAGA-associated factor 29